MSDDKVCYTNIEDNEDIMDATFDTLVGRLDKSKESLDTFFSDIDTRILRYKADTFNKLVNQMDELEDDKQDLRGGQEYYNKAYQGYKTAKQAASDINTATNLGDITLPATEAAVTALEGTQKLFENENVDSIENNREVQDAKEKTTKEIENDKDKTEKNTEEVDKAILVEAQVNKKNDNIPYVIGVTSTITPLSEETETIDAQDALTASIVDGIEEAGEDLLDAIENGPARFKQQVSPYSGNVGVTTNTNKSTAGIIAAASIAAGGAAAGGGIIFGKKLSVTKFTPENWKALGTDYQSVIEKLLRKVGFSSEDFNTFTTSKFKIATSELKEHVKKINKAFEANPSCEDDFMKLYNYSMLDDHNKVIDYLLFITMIIDGRNTIDEYNMYNIINQGLEDANDADFLYTGINMEDYFDESEEEEDIKILNDPTKQEETTTEEKETIEDKRATKEWLQGIGMDE